MTSLALLVLSQVAIPAAALISSASAVTAAALLVWRRPGSPTAGPWPSAWSAC